VLKNDGAGTHLPCEYNKHSQHVTGGVNLAAFK
jgi:hypothetical protein